MPGRWRPVAIKLATRKGFTPTSLAGYRRKDAGLETPARPSNRIRIALTPVHQQPRSLQPHAVALVHPGFNAKTQRREGAKKTNRATERNRWIGRLNLVDLREGGRIDFTSPPLRLCALAPLRFFRAEWRPRAFEWKNPLKKMKVPADGTPPTNPAIRRNENR